MTQYIYTVTAGYITLPPAYDYHDLCDRLISAQRVADYYCARWSPRLRNAADVLNQFNRQSSDVIMLAAGPYVIVNVIRRDISEYWSMLRQLKQWRDRRGEAALVAMRAYIKDVS